ncbi:MAG: hypothetical protein IJ493_06970 [Clostridia bacterium]|nr:hypothetical protein [Clostridia bacterium]
MSKKIFYSELAYVAGILLLALGTALMAQADFGLSMIVAPAYIIHLKVSQVLPFFTFGMAEYTFQGLLILLMVLLLRKFKLSYLFSFVTAIVYGFALDGCMLLAGLIPADAMAVRVLLYVVGTLLCTAGVAFMFHTYISPEAYELFVKEVSAAYHVEIHRFKIGYDLVSCVVSILLSFALFGFGHFEGIKLGTVLNALMNGWLIGIYSKQFERRLEFRDALPLRKHF